MGYKDKADKLAGQRRRYGRKTDFLNSCIGGECVCCMAVTGLQRHHRNPKDKDTHRFQTLTGQALVDEMLKCVMLCAKCHRIWHDALRRFDKCRDIWQSSYLPIPVVIPVRLPHFAEL